MPGEDEITKMFTASEQATFRAQAAVNPEQVDFYKTLEQAKPPHHDILTGRGSVDLGRMRGLPRDIAGLDLWWSGRLCDRGCGDRAADRAAGR
jgi:hypothetical protein